ncbi:MAG: holo-ACP synthase [Candidatus Aegiribacteria sp.]|nr:holo-ACP synthase [Candidatus Aegiribacteria sp.]
MDYNSNTAQGIDIVSISRIRKAVQRSGKRFLHRIFTSDELLLHTDYGLLATRFAAKEAFFKALGTGISGGVRWHDFSLPPETEASLRPEVTGVSYDLLEGRRVLVSVSKTTRTAVAIIVLEGDGESG